jgi:hypothetical protein
MNPFKVCISLAVSIFGIILISKVVYAETVSPPVRYEYVTIRWAGKDNTHIIRPGGEVEFIGYEIKKAKKPERADERSFYMNLILNGLTKEGYEFAGMTTDEIILRRLSREH